MKSIAILGAGSFALEVRWLIDDINRQGARYRVLGHLDDDATRAESLGGTALLGGLSWLESADRDVGLVLGVGFPSLKRRFVEYALKLGYRFETLVHPSTLMAPSVKIGSGSVIGAGNIFTVDIEVGDYVLVNLACTIGHGTRIGPYASLSPHCTISGNTTIGEGVDMGSAVATRPGVAIGAWSVLGLNAGVVTDVPPGVLAVGCPARVKRRLTEGGPSGTIA